MNPHASATPSQAAPSPAALSKGRAKTLLLIGLGLVLGIVGMTAYGRLMQSLMGGGPGFGGPPGDFAVPVLIAAAREVALPPAVEAVGSLRADNTITIAPEIDGRIASIDAAEGSLVKKGARLVVLDQRIRAADLAEAKANLTLSKLNYERAENLLTGKVGTARARDEALARYEQDQAVVARAQALLDKTVLTAPFTGILGLKNASVGAVVEPGHAIFTLTALDPLMIDVRVPEQYLAQLAVGQEATLRLDAFPGISFAGEIAAIDPKVDEAGRSIALRARVPNADGRLRPGLFARVAVTLPEQGPALLIPEQAIVLEGAGAYVYRLENGTAARVDVKLGQRRAGEVQVTEGLAAGDLIVTDGQIKLHPGAKAMPLNGAQYGLTAPSTAPAPPAAVKG